MTLACIPLLLGLSLNPTDVGPIRAKAVVDLSLDSASTMKDTSKAGKVIDEATLQGQPQFISSPFWNQTGQALLLDAAAKSHLEVPDSPDLDRADGVTVSFFFLSLHPLDDPGFHGVFAKRGAEKNPRTNYGINFKPAADVFQVYIHDGAGYKVASYSVKSTVGYSQRVHLTATFDVADAPAADTDTDTDDILIRLFINGKPVAPRASSSGFVNGNDAWLTNVDIPGMLNDVPLTLGSSSGATELTSGVYDEFLLFADALEPAEVEALFVELSGAPADEIAKLDQSRQRAQTTARPAVQNVSPRGLQVGSTTRLTLTGTGLENADVYLDGTKATVKIAETTASRLTADVSLPDNVTPGFYALRAVNDAHISDPVIVTVDRLPEVVASQTSAEKPARLPTAASGTLSGTQALRVWFRGVKGQRVLADVESRRLGSSLEPVVEIKTDRGTPLTIEWRKHELHGDTRAECTLPADGNYFVEVHDLTYKAPGNSAVRVRIGNLAVIDRWVPSGSGRDTVLTARGTGLSKPVTVRTRRGRTPGSVQIEGLPAVDGPVPTLIESEAVELTEQPGDKVQTVDASFAGATAQSIVAVNGTIEAPGDNDVYQLNVSEGQQLHLTLQTRSLASPLDGTLRILNGAAVLAARDTGGTGNDIVLDVTVPAGVKTLQARIGDFTNAGGPTHAYRLMISRAGRVDFQLRANASAIEIPANGSAVLRLSVLRRGPGFAFAGPIRLKIAGDPHVQIAPEQLPEETENRDVFVVLTRTGPPTSQVEPIAIIAESTTGPAVRRIVHVPSIAPVVAAGSQGLVAASSRPVPVTVNLAGAPPQLFRGLVAELPLYVSQLDPAQGVLRFSLRSTERPREKKLAIRALPHQFAAAGQPAASRPLASIQPRATSPPIIEGRKRLRNMPRK